MDTYHLLFYNRKVDNVSYSIAFYWPHHELRGTHITCFLVSSANHQHFESLKLVFSLFSIATVNINGSGNGSCLACFLKLIAAEIRSSPKLVSDDG